MFFEVEDKLSAIDTIKGFLLWLFLVAWYLSIYYQVFWRVLFWLTIRSNLKNGYHAISYNEDGLKFHSKEFFTHFNWSYFDKVLETKNAYLLVVGKKYYLVLKRFFTPDLEVGFRNVLGKYLELKML